MVDATIEHEDLAGALQKQGFVVSTIKGVSMLPLLRQGTDTVVIVPAKPSELKPMDVVLFRDETRGHYVLHRLVAMDEATLTTLGDNCVTCERFPKEWLLGRLQAFYRGEKEIALDSPGYRAYVDVLCKPWKLRVAVVRPLRAAKHRCGNLLRAVGLR